MSEHSNPRRGGDAGMTLPELLIAVMLLGMIIIVLSSAIVVTLRQNSSTEGRINVARSEQSISLWIPADLASASTVDTGPDATPCGAAVCDGIDLSSGSNVMLLTWSTETGNGNVVLTNVSYHFAPAGDGQTYELTRVVCTSAGGGWSCDSFVVLRDLPGPPAGDSFVPGVGNGAACRAEVDPVPCTRPDWVIIVSEPLAADAISESETLSSVPPDERGESEVKDANRVIVSINGGGDSAGAGGGINQISITAGGTVRTTIAANSVQGAPSFVEARSRCGGPMTVVVDESNSIGSSIVDVKAGIRRFVEALAGTPVKIQVVRFHTVGSILGSSDWHHYFDMTNEADVDTLLAAIDDLKGSWSGTNGGTNWEEALFRTFYNADGSTADTIPETVVFFTDGVPTFDRLVYKASPGVLPADPPAPSAPWPASTGSAYSQVAFRRADFISNQFRRSVRMVGVGVGSGITQSSNWISDPGAGYRLQWERGSYSHVRDTIEYQARYQKKNSSKGAYYWVSLATYNATASNRRRDVGWTAVSSAEFQTFENPVNTNSNDGGRTVVASSTPVSTTEYNANVSNPLYRVVSKTWNNGPDWEIWTGSRSSGNSNEYRSTKLYNSPPYEAFDPPVTASTRNDVILARLIAGNDNGTPAVWNGTTYGNAEIADMYVLPQWSQFGTAMEAVALGECGGTLTLQTKIGGTTPAPDPFRYQNSVVKDADGNVVPLEPTIVTTNQQFTTGTFDFIVPNGQYVTVDILPQNYSELTTYSPGSWSCRAGNAPRSVTPIDIPDGGNWKGARVRVAANEAVSCMLSVTR